MDLFFVCGAPKSGTTWLQRILDAHPQVSCSGEGHFIERFTVPAAQVINAYNQQMSMEAAQVYEGRPVYPPMDQSEFDELARGFILGRLRSRKPGPDVRWLGDKTPRYTHQLDALHRLFPRARFVHIVRDPREAVVSLLGHNHRIGLGDALTQGSAQHRGLVAHAVKGWLEAVSAVEAFAARRPELVHEVRYDALHGQPMREMAAVFGFLGAPAGPALIGEITASTSFEAMSGRKPGAEDLSSFFRRGAPGGWRDRLDDHDLAAITGACGELMRRKGFLPPAEAVRGAA